MGYTDQQITILETINYVCESLSIVGSFVIIISYCCFSRLRHNFAYSLVLYLAIADLFRSTARIIGSFLSDDKQDQILCTISAFFINFSSLASFLFVAAIAFVMYSIVNIKFASFWKVKPATMRKRKQRIAITIVIISAIISCFPFTQSAYVYVGAWCWIGADTQHWRWICYYLPLILIFIFCVCIYSIILWHIRKLESAMADQSASNAKTKFAVFRRLKYYPMVLLICFFFPTMRRIYQLFEDEAPFWLGVCHALGSGSYGFLNGMVYGVNQMVTEEYKKGLEGTIRSHHMTITSEIEIECTAGKYDKSIGGTE